MGLFGSFFLLFNNSNFWNGKEESQKNREILNKAKITLSIHQASRFSQSIALARQIYPDTPFYNEAQTSIIRWSEAILEIAQGRAMKGDFEGAIIAAQLVPQEQKTLYLLAQKYLQNWQKLSQQKQYNQVLIDAALGLIRPQQASSYNRAITTLRHINPGELDYDIAQQFIQQWSQRIYNLAKIRGTQGQFSLAIKTARLVPHNTISYDQAQQAIASWQKKLDQ